MKATTGALLLGGASLFGGLVLWQGLADVMGSVSRVGWGVLAVTLFHLAPLVLDALAWRSLFLGDERPTPGRITYLRWISESVDSLLPVAQVGGELVRTRLLVQRGFSAAVSGATSVVDLTLGFFTQILFAVLGVLLLSGHDGRPSALAGTGWGLGIALLALGGFYLAQRQGMFALLASRMGRWVGGQRWLRLVGGAEALDVQVAAIWRRRRRVLASTMWRLSAWLAGAGEVWLTLRFLGRPVGVGEALIIESMGQAARGVGFAVPGALGIQEGGYVLVGRALGLDGSLGLALALVRRAREILLGVPGLVAWQVAEGRQLWLGRRADPHGLSGGRPETPTMARDGCILVSVPPGRGTGELP